MPIGKTPAALGVAATLAVALGVGAESALVRPAAASAAVAPDTLAGPKKPRMPRRIRVELGLVAREAKWSPATRSRPARLSLKAVEPRMAMMAVAPRRELIDVPAATIASNWRRLAGKDMKTNAMIGAQVDGRARLIAVELKLTGYRPSGSQMRFTVTRLRGAGHHPAWLSHSATLREPTLVVDPVISDQIKALWAWLSSLFTTDDPAPATAPSDPVTVKERGGPSVFDTGGGTYAGTDGAGVDSTSGRIAAQSSNLDGVDATYGDLTGSRPDVSFPGGKDLRGAALFDASFGDVVISGPGDGSQTVRDFAIYNAQVDKLSVLNADVGGANFRATDFTSFNTDNAAFSSVDFTGASLGDVSARSNVSDTVFVDVDSNRTVTRGDGNPDAVDGKGAVMGVRMESVDFTSVSMVNADFAGASINSTTFQGCGLSKVDFSGARITGQTGTTTDQAGNTFSTFQPSFENSILDTVTFDGATIANVSFAGVDFSQGVSLDGAHLQNVDFTGAIGLQFVDWSKVIVDGPVYGLGPNASLVGTIADTSDLRSFTTDGVIPEIDPVTGFDTQYGTGYLVDPGTGVRLARAEYGGLIPIDPRTNEWMVDPETGSEIQWTGGELIDPRNGARIQVDYFTGIPEFDK